MKVDFYRHHLDAGHAALVAGVLGSPFLTTGQVSKDVEAQLRAYFDTPHALLTNSWTNGALATLMAMDVGPGDEIIVPAMTFIASANIGEILGAKTVLVDVCPDTLLLTPESVRAAITPRTKVVFPVHLYGQMCDIAAIRKVTEAAETDGQKICIFEDAAHCFEGKLHGDRPGTHGDAVAFSFYATKNVTCGEGGALVVRDNTLAARTMEARLHGMSATAVDRFAGDKYNHWDMTRLGTKANLPDLLAVLLPGQIATIDARLPERQAMVDRYRTAFADGPLRLVSRVAGCESAEHLFVVGVPGGHRDAAISVLNKAGIGVTINYRALPDLSYYGEKYPDAERACPVAVLWGRQTLSLPLFPGLALEEQDYVIKVVREQVYPLIDPVVASVVA